MSRLMPIPSHLDRSESRASIAASDTTYHSFHDIELYAPASPPKSKQGSELRELPDPTSTEMRRQDSGYESLPPRTSTSSQTRRRVSNASSAASTSQQSKPRGRPSIRRSSKTCPYPARTSGQSLYATQSQPPPVAFFHFPAHPTDLESAHQQPSEEPASDALTQLPPQTTHYWTSDRTRRLEYAAIDAASRGVKGWVRRHLVPDCFIPKERQHLSFDDDTGSVRRYRLELDEVEDPCTEKAHRMWPIWGRRTTS